MQPSQPQGISPTKDAIARIDRRRNRGFAGLVLSSLLALAAAGCTTDSKISDPLTQLGNPFDRPSEAGFRAMAKANCGSMSVGDSTVGELMRDDDAFNRLVSSLYSGDTSNDEFMNQVLLEHPAPDANVPATGCVINQLAKCFAETCKVQPTAARAAAERTSGDDAMAVAADAGDATEVAIDPVELPSQSQADADAGTEAAEDATPKPLP
jgi:hypothetical protein